MVAISGGLGCLARHLGPDVSPVLGTQGAAVDGPLRCLLDGEATINRHPSGLPVADNLNSHAKHFGKPRSTAYGVCRKLNGGLLAHATMVHAKWT